MAQHMLLVTCDSTVFRHQKNYFDCLGGHVWWKSHRPIRDFTHGALPYPKKENASLYSELKSFESFSLICLPFGLLCDMHTLNSCIYVKLFA